MKPSDGRKVHAINEPMPGGGWVSTHEDVTEQLLPAAAARRHGRAARAARRRSTRVIAAFRGRNGSAAQNFRRQRGGDEIDRGRAVVRFQSRFAMCRRRRGGIERRGDRRKHRRRSPTDELSSSIGEIARQITQTNNVVHMAVEEAQIDQRRDDDARRIRRRRSATSSSSFRPSPTRPICWRSTPPSRRRAPAKPGRGFAVVASEVKSLAVQTAKATEAIVGQILAVQGSTASAVESIRRITQRMQEIQHYASGVAASIEQQNAATSNISSNVASAAQATQDHGRARSPTSPAPRRKPTLRREVVLDTSHPVETPSTELRRHIEEFPRRRSPRNTAGRVRSHAAELPPLPSAACAAASRAIGTRNGEHDT